MSVSATFDPSLLTLNATTDRSDMASDLTTGFTQGGLTVSNLVVTSETDHDKNIDKFTITIDSVAYGDNILDSNVSMEIYVDYDQAPHVEGDGTEDYDPAQAILAHTVGVDEFVANIPGFEADDLTSLFAGASTTPTNNAPVADGTIDDMTVEWDDGNPVITPDSYFNDPDGDSLTYTVTSARLDGSDSATDSLADWNSWNGDSFDAGQEGDWNITITATDPSGASATQAFTMTVNAASTPDDNTNSVSAEISIDADNLLDNVTLSFAKNGSEVASVAIDDGSVNLSQTIEFDTVSASTDIYKNDLDILDMYAVLDNIGQSVNTKSTHASDIDNDNDIDIMDMYAVLDGIGQKPQSFDLIDANGARVDSISVNDNLDVTIIANGDADMSGAFDDSVTTPDIL